MSDQPLDVLLSVYLIPDLAKQDFDAFVKLAEEKAISTDGVVLVNKDVDGSVTVLELSDLDDDAAGAFDDLDGEAGGLLSEDDLVQAAEALSLGSSALMIVWQDTWAARLVEAIAASGGRLVAHDRLDAESVDEILAATDDD